MIWCVHNDPLIVAITGSPNTLHSQQLVIQTPMRRPLSLVLVLLVIVNASHDNLISNIASRFRDFHPEAIIDVGANTGAFSADLRKYFPDAAILMVEASTHHDSTLKQMAERIGNAEHRIAVLSSTAGTVVPWFQDDANPKGTGNSMFRVSAQYIFLSMTWPCQKMIHN
jgi:hypothetical protein